MEELIKRINELAKKAKEGELTEEEIAERAELRKEYLVKFREGMRSNIMDNLYVVDNEGNKTKIEKKK